MREMKDSGIAWIGEIPKEWEAVPFKSYFTLKKGLNITKADLVLQGIPVINYGQVHSKTNNGTSLTEELIRYVPIQFLDSDSNCLVNNGSFIFADTSEDLSGCGNAVYIDQEFGNIFAGYHTIIASPISNSPNKYLAYLFLTDYWRSQIRSKVTGIKVFSINQKCLRNSSIILPPLPEQQRIATFLDEKCKEIDDLVALQEEMITELQAYKQSVITEAVTKGLNPKTSMKDSGVEWIGKIPEHWEISRIGLHFNITLGKMLCPKQLDSSYTLESYYCAANVHFDGFSGELKKMWFNEREKETYLIQKGDLLIVEGGAGAGGCCVVDEVREKIYIQNSILIARSKIGNDCRYLKYLIEQYVRRGYIDIVCNKATIPHFTKEKVCNVPFIIIPHTEQQAIADYLDTQYSRIDKLIALKRTKIEELQDYKKSVIYEYVTGKKEVPATV